MHIHLIIEVTLVCFLVLEKKSLFLCLSINVSTFLNNIICSIINILKGLQMSGFACFLVYKRECTSNYFPRNLLDFFTTVYSVTLSCISNILSTTFHSYPIHNFAIILHRIPMRPFHFSQTSTISHYPFESELSLRPASHAGDLFVHTLTADRFIPVRSGDPAGDGLTLHSGRDDFNAPSTPVLKLP